MDKIRCSTPHDFTNFEFTIINFSDRFIDHFDKKTRLVDWLENSQNIVKCLR